MRAERSAANDRILIEGFIPGREFALEGLMHHGGLHVLALFDKPDPLDGPFFEETIYVTPSSVPADVQQRIAGAVRSAAAAIGLWHGPIHAECRVNDDGVFVLEVAARPIGGLCSRALRFNRGASPVDDRRSAEPAEQISLEELLLRHALGEAPHDWSRAPHASGVMMIPIPTRGLYRRVSGVEEARLIVGVEDVMDGEGRSVVAAAGGRQLSRVHSRAVPGSGQWSERFARRTRLRFAIDPSRGHNRRMAHQSSSTSRRSGDQQEWPKVMCVKFQKELPVSDDCPGRGTGQRIYDQVSKDAWNVGRAYEDDPQRVPPDALAERGADLVAKHMEDFFFGEGAALPPGYVPQQAK
jgi:Fe-S cluster biosynthesis and repair protein YggX